MYQATLYTSRSLSFAYVCSAVLKGVHGLRGIGLRTRAGCHYIDLVPRFCSKIMRHIMALLRAQVGSSLHDRVANTHLQSWRFFGWRLTFNHYSFDFNMHLAKYTPGPATTRGAVRIKIRFELGVSDSQSVSLTIDYRVKRLTLTLPFYSIIHDLTTCPWEHEATGLTAHKHTYIHVLPYEGPKR